MCAGGAKAYQYIYDVFIACSYAGTRRHVTYYMHFATVKFDLMIILYVIIYVFILEGLFIYVRIFS